MNAINYVRLARPGQYLKNLFVFLPAFFGYRLDDPQALGRVCLAFAAFCLASSAVYVLNDINDVAEDRNHPVKRLRPIASGAVAPGSALVFAGLLCLALAVLLLILDSAAATLLVGAYLALNVAYTFKLKHIALVDIFCVAIGFVIRVYVGGLVIDVPPSHWLVLMTFLVALFLVLAKRRDDLVLSADGEEGTRRNLAGYNFEFISASMNVMASVTIVSYIMYTLSSEVQARHHSDKFYLTAFWVIFGFMRYMQLTFVKGKSGSPTLVLLRDRMIQAVLVLWVLTFFLILYVD